MPYAMDSAMAKMINVRYPSYKTGLVEAIGGIISSDLQVLNHALI